MIIEGTRDFCSFAPKGVLIGAVGSRVAVEGKMERQLIFNDHKIFLDE